MLDNEAIYEERSNEDAFYERYGVKPNSKTIANISVVKAEDLEVVFDDEDSFESE